MNNLFDFINYPKVEFHEIKFKKTKRSNPQFKY